LIANFGLAARKIPLRIAKYQSAKLTKEKAMVKIRLVSESLEEIEAAKAFLEKLLPNMRFTTPKHGNNPKYADNPQYLSYGEPRMKNKKPARTNFNGRLNNLKKPKKK
jgi:hypothetical protein